MKYIFSLLLFTTIFSFSSSVVFAHVLKVDGTIGAVVHIDPEDDPIVGEKTTVYFDIKDKSDQFKAENCFCQFIVKKDGVEVFNQSLNGTMATYNFPEKNIYTLELKGTPKVEGQFQSFKLDYDIRVERELNTSGQNIEQKSDNFFLNHIPHILVIVLVTFICGFIVYKEKRKK